MKLKPNSFLYNLSFVFGAQVLVLVISVLRALILPKFLPVEGFGYWEVYWFYTSYVGIFCLGYNDGIYLKYGECNVDQLPMEDIRSANRLYCLFLSVVAAIAAVFCLRQVDDSQMAFSLCFAAANILILGLTVVFIFVFQITAQFKKYSFFSVLDKIAVLITIFFLLIINEKNFRYIVVADFASKAIVLLVMIYKMPEMIFGSFADYKRAFKFMLENMSVGIKLMVANLMSMLLVGTGRFIVQYYGGIKDFAIYSFGISLTGLVLTAVTAISLVLYPTIKRMTSSSYGIIFKKINTSTRVIGLVSLLLFFPMYFFVVWFYPNYISVLDYLSFLFLIVYFQCKISLLNNTFYKVMRLETQMLVANLSCVLLFILLAVFLFPAYPQMKTIAICTMIAMLVRCYSSELSLSKKLGIKPDVRIAVELAMITVFLLTSELLPVLVSAALFVLVLGLWLILDRKENMVIIELLTQKNQKNSD